MIDKPVHTIYTDRDYLDAQFLKIDQRFDRHDKSHKEFSRRVWTAVLALGTAGLGILGLNK